MPGRGRWPAWLVAVVILSLAVRLFAWWVARDRVPVGDPFNYVEIAGNILSGRGMVIDDPQLVPNLRAFYPPGYPLLLASIGLIFPLKATTFLVLNTAIDAAAAVLIARIGARLGEERAGVVAGAAYFLWPEMMLLAPLAYKEGLVSLLVLVQIAALLGAARGERFAAAGFGIAAGLEALVQPAMAPLSVLLALVLWPEFPDFRAWMRKMAGAAAIACLVLAPWWLRNAFLFGQFVPFTTAGGAGLWVGATPLSDGSWVQTPARLRIGDELTMSAAMGEEARRIITADPLGYLARCFGKVINALIGSRAPIRALGSMDPWRHHELLISLSLIPIFANVGLLLATGLAAIFTRRSIAVRLMLAGFAQILLFGMWFEFDERHRYFLIPLMLLVAAIDAVRWLGHRKSSGYGPAQAT